MSFVGKIDSALNAYGCFFFIASGIASTLNYLSITHD